VPQQKRSKLSSEKLDHTIGGVQQLHQRWNNRFRLPLSELGERYLRGDLSIILDCSQRGEALSSRQRFSLVMRQDGGDCVHANARRKGQTRARCHDCEFPMLIESVHIVDDANGIVRSITPSLVWLQLFNQGQHSRVSDALYFSLVSGLFFFRRKPAIDGKLKQTRMIPPQTIWSRQDRK
jgi:hypothetical protein